MSKTGLQRQTRTHQVKSSYRKTQLKEKMCESSKHLTQNDVIDLFVSCECPAQSEHVDKLTCEGQAAGLGRREEGERESDSDYLNEGKPAERHVSSLCVTGILPQLGKIQVRLQYIIIFHRNIWRRL